MIDHLIEEAGELVSRAMTGMSHHSNMFIPISLCVCVCVFHYFSLIHPLLNFISIVKSIVNVVISQ